jgi:hypothetical protein
MGPGRECEQSDHYDMENCTCYPGPEAGLVLSASFPGAKILPAPGPLAGGAGASIEAKAQGPDSAEHSSADLDLIGPAATAARWLPLTPLRPVRLVPILLPLLVLLLLVFGQNVLQSVVEIFVLFGKLLRLSLAALVLPMWFS